MTTTNGLVFQKAKRTSVKLKIGLQGPSGSGKTMGALALARSLAPDGKVAVIDTENESASFYADSFEFETLNLAPPYTSARYIEAVDAAIKAGFDVLVIDSISHQWAGSGGILERKDAVDARGGNSFANWGPFTKEHERFKARLLEAPIHIIATLRTKQEYSLDKDDKGKAAPKKMGMAPIQREGFEYEFGIVFELQMDHRAKVSKDRTGLFDDSHTVNMTDVSIGSMLRGWLASGKPVATVASERTPEWARQITIPAGPLQGQKLGSCGIRQLHTFSEWADKKIEEQGDEVDESIAAFKAACEILLESKSNGKSVKMPPPGKVEDAIKEETDEQFVERVLTPPANDGLPFDD